MKISELIFELAKTLKDDGDMEVRIVNANWSTTRITQVTDVYQEDEERPVYVGIY